MLLCFVFWQLLAGQAIPVRCLVYAYSLVLDYVREYSLLLAVVVVSWIWREDKNVRSEKNVKESSLMFFRSNCYLQHVSNCILHWDVHSICRLALAEWGHCLTVNGIAFFWIALWFFYRFFFFFFGSTPYTINLVLIPKSQRACFTVSETDTEVQHSQWTPALLQHCHRHCSREKPMNSTLPAHSAMYWAVCGPDSYCHFIACHFFASAPTQTALPWSGTEAVADPWNMGFTPGCYWQEPGYGSSNTLIDMYLFYLGVAPCFSLEL